METIFGNTLFYIIKIKFKWSLNFVFMQLCLYIQKIFILPSCTKFTHTILFCDAVYVTLSPFNISKPVPSVPLAVSEVLGSKVCLSRDKYNTMCCLESEHIGQRITTDWQTAQVHVLPMMQLNFKVSGVSLN